MREGNSILFTKRQLRLEKIAARDMLTPKERREKSEAIVRNILADPAFQRAQTVMIYRSVRGEVQLDPLPALRPGSGGRGTAPGLHAPAGSGHVPGIQSVLRGEYSA